MIVSKEQFIKLYLEAYRTGRNQVWMAERLDVKPQSVRNRVMNYRKRGINLPGKLTTVKSEADNLNKLLQKELKQ